MVCKIVDPGSIITFTETLKPKSIVSTDLGNLPKNLARSHYESE
jgi:hypothetical protein